MDVMVTAPKSIVIAPLLGDAPTPLQTALVKVPPECFTSVQVRPHPETVSDAAVGLHPTTTITVLFADGVTAAVWNDVASTVVLPLVRDT